MPDMKTDKGKQHTIWFPDAALLKSINTRAQAEGRSMNNLIVWLLAQGMKKGGKKP